MNRTSILFMVVWLIAGCDRGPFEPVVRCDSWDACPGGLVVEWDVIPSRFRQQRPEFLTPGDSVLIRTVVSNRSNLTLDSVVVYGSAAGTSGIRSSLLHLSPGDRSEKFDTLVAGGYTFDHSLQMYVAAYSGFEPSGLPKYIDVTVTTSSSLPRVARSGFKFDILNSLGPTVPIQDGGRTYNAVKLPHKVLTGILGQVSNPYDLPTKPLTARICIFNDDYCPGYVHGPTISNPIPSGGTDHFEFTFPMDTQDLFYDWWSQTRYSLEMCVVDAERVRGCVYQSILVTPNFEVDCTVTTARIGVTIRDSVPDCGYYKDGSSYRLDAKKGEQYAVRMIGGEGTVFISGPEGIYLYDPKPTQLTIPADGTYYVSVQHRATVRFQVDRIN